MQIFACDVAPKRSSCSQLRWFITIKGAKIATDLLLLRVNTLLEHVMAFELGVGQVAQNKWISVGSFRFDF